MSEPMIHHDQPQMVKSAAWVRVPGTNVIVGDFAAEEVLAVGFASIDREALIKKANSPEFREALLERKFSRALEVAFESAGIIQARP